jgi:putative MATE family efflux protein
LAAVGSSVFILFLINSLFIGATIGAQILISQFFGTDRLDDVKKMITTSFIFLFFSSIVVTVIGLLLSRPILSLLNVPAEVMDQAVTYLDIMFAGTIFSIGYLGISAVFRGLGNSKTPLLVIIACTIINIVLDLIFVIILQIGVAGVAYATLIAQAVSFVIGFLFLFKRYRLVTLKLRDWKFEKQLLTMTIRVGIPVGIRMVTISASALFVSALVNSFGTPTIAASTVAYRLEQFAMVPAMNVASASSTFVGQNLAAGLPDRVKRGVWAGSLLNVGFSIIVTILLVVFGETMASWFDSDPNVIHIAGRYFLIVGSFSIVFAFFQSLTGAIQGAGQTLMPLICTIITLLIIRVPVAHLLANTLQWGSDGIWFSQVVGWIIAIIFIGIYYKRGKWQNSVVVKAKEKTK